MANQLDGLVDGRDCVRASLNFDLTASTESPCTNPCGKGTDDVDGVEGFFESEEGVTLEEGHISAPVSPVLVTIPGSLRHDAIGNSSPRRQEITRDTSVFGNWNSVQEFCFEIGKVELK